MSSVVSVSVDYAALLTVGEFAKVELCDFIEGEVEGGTESGELPEYVTCFECYLAEEVVDLLVGDGGGIGEVVVLYDGVAFAYHFGYFACEFADFGGEVAEHVGDVVAGGHAG